MRRPLHRTRFVIGMACLALGASMPALRRAAGLEEGTGDFLWGLTLGLALGFLLLAFRGPRPSCPVAPKA